MLPSLLELSTFAVMMCVLASSIVYLVIRCLGASLTPCVHWLIAMISSSIIHQRECRSISFVLLPTSLVPNLSMHQALSFVLLIYGNVSKRYVRREAWNIK